jgi:hypothetical protein
LWFSFWRYSYWAVRLYSCGCRSGAVIVDIAVAVGVEVGALAGVEAAGVEAVSVEVWVAEADLGVLAAAQPAVAAQAAAGKEKQWLRKRS